MKFGLVGGRLSHSFSPLIHSVYGDYDYKLFELEKSEVEGFFRKRDFCGVNVTIPYKTDAFSACDQVSEVAARTGSVNTVVKRADGSLYGENTDFFGVIYTLNSLKSDIHGKKALVLGSGGASRAVCAALIDKGAREIITVSRTGIANYENIGIHSDSSFIINATPVGMYPENGRIPLDLNGFHALEAVIDIIYNPIKTALLLQAEKLGIENAGGMKMLAAQAKRSSELFTGTSLDDSLIEKAADTVLKKTRNIVLIGMPGSGKTSAGRLAAATLNRPFADIDELVVKKTARTAERIILSDGESAFRAYEKECAAEAGKATGTVIAAGGGTLLDPENADFLRQNGFVIFINRSPDKLETEGRPLSSPPGALAELYKKRLPIYKKYADATVNGDNPLDEVVKEIIKYAK